MDKKELWDAVLAQTQFNISKANFATWFKNTSIISRSEEKVVIGVPNAFSKEWLEGKYHKLIIKILHAIDKTIKDVSYVIVKPTTEVLPEVPAPMIEQEQFDFQELKINKETNLNVRYNFENFVIGPFNELAHAAAWAATQAPGLVYNPLFIYGGVGLGKTHLLQAIGNEIGKKFPKKKIRYIPSEKFVSGVVTAIQNKAIGRLKEAYCEADVLLIDDVQFLAGKDKSQEEFFHIFNTLYETNRQIALSSDRPPKAIPAIEERLKSRFEGGMIADIGAPDFETRMAILKQKAKEKAIDLEDKVLEYVASSVQKNIRELEGALNQLIIHQRINQRPPDLETARDLLKKLFFKPAKIINVRKIIQAVAEFYDLKEEDLLTSSRKREVAKPRHIAMYLLRKELKASYPFIGRKFGGRDHTTAIHACEKINKEATVSQDLAEEINFIKQRIYESLDPIR